MAARAVARAVGQVDRRFIAGHEALVAVRGGIADGAQGLGVFQESSDIVEGHLRQTRVLVAGKEGLALFPEALVSVHAAAIVSEEGLGHEGDGFAMFFGRRS